jgi:hypothetical protein
VIRLEGRITSFHNNNSDARWHVAAGIFSGMRSCGQCVRLERLRTGLAEEYFDAAIEFHAQPDADAAKAMFFVAGVVRELDRICSEHKALHVRRQTAAAVSVWT